MNTDWRATTYAPVHLNGELFSAARALCDYDIKAPRAGPADDARTPTPRVAPWPETARAASACAFDEAGPSLCYLTLRKVPRDSVQEYHDLYRRRFTGPFAVDAIAGPTFDPVR